MLTEEEKQLMVQAKKNGLTKEQALAQLSQSRGNISTPIEKTPLANKVTEFLGLGGATETFGKVLARQGIGTETPKEVTQEFVEKPTSGQVAGALGQTGSVVGGLAFGTPATLAGKMALGAGLGYAYDVGQDLIEKKGTGEVLTPDMGTVIGAALPVAFKGVEAGIGALKKPVSEGVEAVSQGVGQNIPESTTVQGVKQTATDIAERVPRFVSRVGEAVQEQGLKAERIRVSTPSVAQAIKVDLPESLIQTIPKADPVTKKAFKQVLDIAESPKVTLGQKSNPAIVGGELASKQYDVIEKQRKTIGDAIGEATKQLSKTEKINMQPAYSQLDNILSDQGIRPVYNAKGVELDFSKSNLAPKQRQVVKDLYALATEAGDNLSPYEIHKKDQLFSAIQREARADQVSDVLIDLPDGKKMDLFRAFRDVYSNELDNVSPEIKNLNRKYRNVVTLIDDIENSIFKTPNFNITKSTDQAEFAKVNLRRIFGEAQSSPVYEAIADEMDAISRQLGYADASPKEVAAFAQEIRDLYPETIPKTGFQGGIRGALSDIIGSVTEAGKVDVRDKQKALRALLEETSDAK